jgi:hypothetical protein
VRRRRKGKGGRAKAGPEQLVLHDVGRAGNTRGTGKNVSEGKNTILKIQNEKRDDELRKNYEEKRPQTDIFF